MTEKQLKEKVTEDVTSMLKYALLSSSTTRVSSGIARYLIKTQIDADMTCPTAYAAPLQGGKLKIGVNPNFFYSLPEQYRFPLFVHEVFHIIMKHFLRFEFPKDPARANLLNIALDCAINQLISEFTEKFEKDCPFGPINIHSFTDMVNEKGYTEEVLADQDAGYYYRILLSLPNPPEPPQGGKGGDGDGESPESGNGPWIEDHKRHAQESEGKESESAASKGDIEKIVQDIARDMREAGCSDSDLDKLGLANKSGAVPWKKIFRSYMAAKVSEVLRTDRNKPHRKYGLALPKRRFDIEAEFILVLDTTGSMFDDLPYVFAEVERFAKMYNAPFDIYIVDTGLHGPYRAKNVKAFKALELPQGGGTDFRCLSELKTNGLPVIFFTDTYGQWPENKVSYPLLVLTTSKGSAPAWARSVDISSELAALKAA